MDLINGAIPKEWSDYITQVPGALEVIPSVLYSTKTFTSASTTVLTFYDFVEGSRPDLTNMQSANQMSNPESFLIQNMRLYFKNFVQSDPSGTADAGQVVSQFNDVVKLASQGILQLKISNKQYGPWPLWMLPANSFVKGAMSTGSDLVVDYGQIDGFLYPVEPNLMLAPVQNFTVTLSWPAGTVTLSNATVDIEVLFDGKRARAVA